MRERRALERGRQPAYLHAPPHELQPVELDEARVAAECYGPARRDRGEAQEASAGEETQRARLDEC